MKNFTVAMLSFYGSMVSNSSQPKTVKKSEAELIRNNRANLFKNISINFFLWGFYGIFPALLKIVKGGVLSFGTGLNSLEKYRSYSHLVTGSRVYLNGGQASIISRSLIVVVVGLLTINSHIASAQCTGVAGTVFRDFNLNGKKDTYDIGLAGVTVKSFNSANVQIGVTAITGANGTYAITGVTGQVRVEFLGLPIGYVSGPDGTSSSTSVQFVTANACNVDYGVNQPEDFCAKEGVQPKVAVPCYANGKYDATGTNGAGLEDALVSFAYNKTGDKAATGNAPYLMSSYNKIGAVWGMAYNKFNKTLFATAFMKRHSGFGPKGIAGLYVVQNADNSGSGYVITGINLETIAGLSVGFAGTEPTRNLQTDKTQPSDDGGNAVFNAVGKMSFGDCELSEDGNTLYVTNLFDKKIYAFNVSNPLVPTLIGSFLVPSPGCAVASEYAPFGLKYYRGKLYVGVICTAQSSQPASNGLSSANLKATVYELNSGTFTTVLPSFSLNYGRGFSNSGTTSYAIWRPWVSTWSQVPSNIAETYPQPILSDIEFDTDGSMILGFADRFSHQLGNANYAPGTTSNVTGRVEGDVMRATKSGSSWIIENNGTASGTTTSGVGKGGGPGGGEYYFGDLTIDHDEPAMGGLLLFPGSGEVMSTTAGPVNIFYSGGTRRLNNQTGDYLYTGAPIAWNSVSGYRLNFDGRPVPTGDYKLYNGSTPSTFGKASGLGDLEIFCSLAPLEIGNRIWRDYDQDGIQDANEPGINAVTVLLFKGGTQVGTTSTNTAGEYYFNDANVTGGLLPNMAYQIRVLTNQVGNTLLSPKNVGGNDLVDSDGDATIVSGYAVIDLTTGTYGESNHTYDVGFSPNCPTLSNPQPNSGNVAICSGAVIPSLSLTLSNVGTQPLPVATSVRWCAFNSVQTDPYTTTGATCLTTASTTTLADGTITGNNLTGLSSIPGIYYVYALLNPTPDANNPYCRPYVSYIVTVSAIPSPPSSVSGGSACKVGTTVAVSMSAVCASGTTPTWYSSTASTSALATSVGYSPSISATTTFYVGCKDNTSGCESAGASRLSVVATVFDTPSSPTITVLGGKSSSCGSPITLESACSTGSLKWSNNATTAQIVVSTSGTYTATCTTTGVIACTSPVSNTVTVTINNTPTAPTSANLKGDAICQPGVVNLTATCGTGEIAQWYNGTSISSTFLYAGTTYSPTIQSTTTFYVACKNTSTGCETAAVNRASVIGTVNPNLPAPSAANVTTGAICNGGVIDLTATCSVGQTPQWYGNNTGSVLLYAGVSYSPNINITTTFYVACKDDNTGCETLPVNRRPVVGTVIKNVTNGGQIAVSQQNCGAFDPSAFTSTSPATGGSTTPEYIWLKNTIDTIFTATNQANWIPLVGATGETFDAPLTSKTTAYIRCSRSSGPFQVGKDCDYVGESNVVVIQVNPIPNPPSTPKSDKGVVCINEVYTLSATCGANEIVKWYDASGTSFTALTITATAAGTYNYFVGCKETTTGTKCETLPANRAIVTVIVNTVPTAPTDAKSNKSVICIGEFITLSASCGVGQEAKWYDAAGVALTSLNFAPSPVGTYNYYVGCKSTSTDCETPKGVRANVKVIVNDIPTAPTNVKSDKGVICLGESITLSATCGAGEEAKWYDAAGVALTSLNFAPSPVGTYNYFVGCRNTVTNCETAGKNRVKVTVIVNYVPIAPTSVNVKGDARCDPGVVNLTATCGTGEVAQWYSTGTTPAFVFAGSTYSPSISTSTTYTVACKNTASGCETPAAGRTSVIGTVNLNLSAPTDAKSNKDIICLNESYTLSASCGVGQTVKWYDGAGVSITTLTYTGTSTGTFNYSVGCTNATGCETLPINRAKVTVVVNPIPTAPTDAKSDKGSICIGESITLSATCGVGQTAKWYDAAGVALTTLNFAPSPIGTYNYYVGCKSNTTDCETPLANRAKITVVVNSIPPAPTDAKSDKGAICIGESITLSATCGTGQTAQWYNEAGVALTTLNFAPSPIGTYNYFVGCKSTSTDCETPKATRAKVTVVVNPIPTAPTNAKSDKGVICLGETITLSATCGTGEEAKWYDAAGVALTSLNFAPVAVTTYNYYVGCKNTFTGCETAGNNRAKVTVIVDKIPSQPVASSNKGRICLGETFTLSATCGTNETPVWYNGTPTGATFTTFTFTPTVSGTLKYYASCKSTTGAFCETAAANRKEVIVIVNDNPIAMASVKDNTVCTGSTIELVGGADGNTYAWSGPNGYTSSLQSPIIANATASRAGNYIIMVSNGVGCSTTAVVSVSVLVNPVATASGNVICVNETVILKSGATLSGTGNTVLSYTWSGPNNFTNSTQNPTIANALPNATGTYTVLITDANGCTATATASVVVNILPTATASNNSPVCVGMKIDLKAEGGTSYSWKGPNSFTSTSATPSILIADKVKNEGVYTVTVTDAKGCEAMATTSVIVNTNPVPVATSNVTICYKETVQLGVNGAAGTYAWKGSDGFTSTQQSPSYKPVSANTFTYTVTVTGAGGCTATATTSVIVKPNPVVTLSSTTICAGSIGTITASGADKYSWAGPGTFTTTSANLSITNAGVYIVTGTTNECTATATASVVVNAVPTVTVASVSECAGVDVKLEAKTNATKFTWTGSNFTSTEQNPIIAAAKVVTGVYSVTVEDVSGCKGTATAQVTINPLPTASATAPSKVCFGSPLKLTGAGTGTNFSWTSSNGFTSTQQSPDVIPLPGVGTYTYIVTVKNGTQCTATASVIVVINALPTANATGTTVCAGTEIKVNVMPTFAAYAWTGVNNFTASTQNPTVSVSATVANTGTYQVIVTDVNGCTAIATTSITVKVLPTVTATGTTICNGGTGTISANGADTYTWTGPSSFTATGANPTVNAGGTYTVIGTNLGGCTATATANVSVTPITLIPPVVNKVCKGASVTLETTYTATGKDWKWIPGGATTPTINVIVTAVANYKVTFADKVSGCKFEADINVEPIDNPAPVIKPITAKCIGEAIKLEVSGSATDKFSWTGSGFNSTEQNPTVSPLPTTEGTYTYGVTVTRTGGCTGMATTSVVIKPSPALTITPAISICAGDKGTLIASGADSYSWTGGGFTATTASIEVTTQGVYSVIGTKGGCTASATTGVTVNSNPTATASATSPVCIGTEIKFTATGGGTYSWKGPSSFTSTSSTPNILVADKAKHEGTYTVIVTSDKGCTATATASVVVNTNPNPLATTNGKVCLGDTIRLSVTAGTTYAWSGTGFTSTVREPKIVSTSAGTFAYTVTVSGNGGCTGTATTSVMVNALPTANATGTAVCARNEVKLNVTPTFSSYAWTGVNSFTASTQNPLVTANATAANNGIYQVLVKDANGCTAIAITNVTVKALPTVTVTPVTICAGVTGTLTATGADTYAWSSNTGETFTSTTATLLVTRAGTYSVTGTNAGGCTAIATTTVTVNTKPNPEITQVTTKCIGEPIVLNVSGGTGNTYSWTGSQNFTSSVQNPTVTPTPTTPGTYTYAVLVSGTGGCTGTATTSVVVKPNPALTITPAISICAGTKGTLTASGADSYSWTGGGFTATTASIEVTTQGVYSVMGTKDGCTATATSGVTVKPVPTVTVSPLTLCAGATGTLLANTNADSYLWSSSNAGFTATTKDVSVSQAGTYTVTVTKDGCTAIATTTVDVKPNITLTVSTALICAGATTTLTVSGANTYTWTGPGTFTATGASPTVSATGTYTVIGTSGNCSASATTTVGANGSANITATSQEICTGITTATLTATGGVTYAWTGPGTFTATGANPVVSVEGVYTVTGTNAGGCVGTATASLTIKANPTVSITGNTTICTIGSTTLTVNSNGTYVWSGPSGFSATSKDVSVDKTGLYTVTVSNNGCQAVGTVNVIADEIYVKAIGQVVCEGIKKTDLTSIVSTKSGVLSYAWIGSDGFMSTEKSPWIIKPTASATYTLTVLTNAGCTGTATTTITVTPAPTATYAVTFCKGGKATLTANGGFNATYSWTPGGFTTSSIQVSTAGTYDVTVTDTSGCISKGKFFVTESAAANAIITGNTSLCASGSTTLTVNAGATGETYSWTGVGGFTSTSQMITVSTPGDYAVLVKTVEGCEGTAKVTVTAGFTPTAVCGPVCEGDSIRFTATQLRGLTYSWSKNGTFISSSADPKLLNVQKSDAGVYEVVITGFGCTATVVATLVVYARPSELTASAINSTCDANVSKNDGQVKLAGTFTGLTYDIVEGATYTGTKKYADATNIPSDGIVKSSIANPATAAGTKYTVRVFNANNCYTDYTVTIQQVTCDCGVAKCVPYGVTKTKSGKR